jgi:sarcosine oxidase subunit beta
VIATEVLVIGGGIAGVSAAYHLRRLGHEVALVERDDLAAHASGLNSGAISAMPQRHGRDLEADLTSVSLDIFRSLQLDLGHDIEFRQSGALRAIRTEAEHALAREIVAHAMLAGVRLELLTGREARAIEPELAPELLGAIYSPLNAEASPVKATRALALAAQREGCSIRIGHAVTAITVLADSTYRARAGAETVSARTVVIAAGPWIRQIGAMLHLDIPVVPVRGQMWATGNLPPRLFHNLSAMESALHWHREPGGGSDGPPGLTHRGDLRLTRHLYGRQTRAGVLIFGGDRQLVGDTTVPDPTGIESNRAHAAELVPLLRTLPIHRTWAGLMPFTPDGRPVIGPVPEHPNLYLIGGMGSSGFGEGPGAGKLLADWIHTRVPPAVLADAHPDRCVRVVGEAAHLRRVPPPS